MSTQKYDSGIKDLGDITVEESFDTGARTLTGIRAEVSEDTTINLYCSFIKDVWDIVCNDSGDPYVLTFKESNTYIPLNPQFFYGLNKIKIVIVSGSLNNVRIIERMV